MSNQNLMLTNEVKEALEQSKIIAREYGHGNFSSPHLLRAMMRREAGLVAFLDTMGKDVGYIREWADVRIEGYPKSSFPVSDIDRDKAVHAVLREADFVRIKQGKDEVDGLSLLAALVTPGVAFSFEQMRSFPILREELLDVLESGEHENGEPNGKGSGSKQENQKGADRLNETISKFCVDKTALAKAGKIDPIVGRDRETKMIAEILGRRSKPNVIIVGDPGVGKTALIEGLANAIVNDKVPKHLKGSKLLELDLGALVAGAAYKGEIEDRIKKVLAELKGSERVTLFVDEIHALMDPNRGLSGVANLLKPELARGEITVIGATTNDEFREYLEPEEAFMRRFEMVRVEEPNDHVCRQMLDIVIPFYEKHHEITVDKDASTEAIRLARRYLKDRRLPDAAIDLIDRTMAAIKMMNDTSGSDIQHLKERYANLTEMDDPEKDDVKYFLYEFENRLSPILLAMLTDDQDPSALTEPAEIFDYVKRGIDVLEEKATEERTTIAKVDIAAMVAYKTGIPMGKVQSKEKERLLNMEETLQSRVIGQDACDQNHLRCHYGIPFWTYQSRSADRFVLLFGAYRYRQNRIGQSLGTLPIRR